MNKFNKVYQGLLAPVSSERKEVLERTWEGLPTMTQTPSQVLGRHSAGCTATYHVMERCDFSCTACYLANTANSTPPLPFSEVQAQLDAIRVHVGPGGPVQITSGEVTLLPVRDLTRIVRYAVDIGLTPMVMTHGETFREDPSYLEVLMREGGLDRVSIHIDTTQRGRRAFAKKDTEVELHPLRNEFAELVRATRKRTGLPLHAAQTVTVTPDNLSDMAEVTRWALKNADAFRLLSFQPTADVGRTRTHAVAGSDSRRRELWAAIEAGAGQALNPSTFHFGHPRCNNLSFMFVVKFDEEIHLMEVVRDGSPIDARFRQLLLRAFPGFSADDADLGELLGRMFGYIVRSPWVVPTIAGYCAFRTAGARRWLPRFFQAVAGGRSWSISPFVIVIHHFMSRDELDTEEGRQRLEACVFRLPINGKMVSMCELNGTDLRRDLNVEEQNRLVSLPT